MQMPCCDCCDCEWKLNVNTITITCKFVNLRYLRNLSLKIKQTNSFRAHIMGKASQTGGVKPMSIAGRYVSERERLLGMTDAERAFRKQWLKDQELSPNEPRKVPEMYKATYNPIRRAYRWPLDQLAKIMEPALGAQRAYVFRYFTGKIMLGVAGIYWATYYFKYNKSDWTRKGGWRVIESGESVHEGDPRYPWVSPKSKGADYASRGFNEFELNL
ncbi:unnamed protein product [Phaedon cochleariae]|uniref:NADH dehydrogenase [ubiquinone] 1 beta subcomplex subunit 6 n=1 Tax=Phaedon cochleariae TaxID=80249 RepID=A0A9P0DEL5_PHACE|nr:unnamed protein product [Phaedon cochleariae]